MTGNFYPFYVQKFVLCIRVNYLLESGLLLTQLCCLILISGGVDSGWIHINNVKISWFPSLSWFHACMGASFFLKRLSHEMDLAFDACMVHAGP